MSDHQDTRVRVTLPEGVDGARIMAIAWCIAELDVIDAKLAEVEALRARRAELIENINIEAGGRP